MNLDSKALSPTQRIEHVFGWPGFPHALIYNARLALRFELSGDAPGQIGQFLQAIDRARAVVRATFEESSSLTAIVSYHDGERRSSRSSTSFKALTKMGFQSPFGAGEKIHLHDAEYIEAFGQDRCRYWHAAEFINEPSQVDILLWASAARDLPVNPTAQWLEQIYIVDFERGIAVHIYDDRGMDVAAATREPLQHLYAQFNDWLLDHDRPQMDRAFSRNF